MKLAANMRRLALGIPAREVRFDTRGFPGGDRTVRQRLEKIIVTFLEGYHTALENPRGPDLAETLDRSHDAHHVGFAYEGAGLCHAVLDLILPGSRNRLRDFIEGPAEKHDYIAAVGAGFAAARIPWGRRRFEWFMHRLDPMIAWCVPDGYGFHQGYFHHRETIDECGRPPAFLPADCHRLFDSGVGRSLWWVKGGDGRAIRDAIDRFPEERRAEMWCGIGVAAAYAGGIENDQLGAFLDWSGDYRADFISGAPFAARMRQKGGNPSSWTEFACRTMADSTADEAANLGRECAESVFAMLPSPDEQRRFAYPRLRDLLAKKAAPAAAGISFPNHPKSQPDEVTIP